VKHEDEPNVPVANCAYSTTACCFPMMRLNVFTVMLLALFSVLLILYIYCATDDSIYKAVHDYFYIFAVLLTNVFTVLPLTLLQAF
jgi:predicted membrane protein